MADTKIQNINMPHTEHLLPRSKQRVMSDARGIIECTNSDADVLLALPGWARVGLEPRQIPRTDPDAPIRTPDVHEVGGGGMIGHANRRADELIAEEERRIAAEKAAAERAEAEKAEEAAKAEAAKKTATSTSSEPLVLPADAKREDIVAFAELHGVKLTRTQRSAPEEELRAHVVAAVEEAAKKAAATQG